MELDPSQERAFKHFRDALKTGNPNKLIVFGTAGSGKTRWIISIVQYMKDNGIQCVIGAPTGRAVLNLRDHPNFAQNTPCMTLEMLKIHINNNNRKALPPFVFERGLGGVLIVDEVGMMSESYFNAIVYQRLGNRLNVKVVLCGDLDQLPCPKGLPWYVHQTFKEELREGSVQHIELTGNHRNGGCEELNEILKAFKENTITQRAKNILDAIGRRPLPAHVSIYIAQAHDGLRAFNDRQARRVKEMWPPEKPVRSVVLVPERYHEKGWTMLIVPTVFCPLRHQHIEGTRVLITKNIKVDGTIIACNGDFGIVTQLLCPVDNDGNALFTRKNPEAVRVRLDRTLEEIDIHAFQKELEKKTDKKPAKKQWMSNFVLGYAGTIHTAQGQTIEPPNIVAIKLPASPEALFVAITRVRKVSQLRFDGYDDNLDNLKRMFCTPQMTRAKREFLNELKKCPQRTQSYSKRHRVEEIKSLKRKRQALGF